LCIDKSELACCLYCTKSGWRCISHFPPALALANGKQGLKPEEMSQTLLTSKKQGNLDEYTPVTLLNQRKLALTARDTLLHYKIIEAPKKNLKPAPYLRLELTMIVIKSQIHLVTQSL
jgi:hypothetical protein